MYMYLIIASILAIFIGRLLTKVYNLEKKIDDINFTLYKISKHIEVPELTLDERLKFLVTHGKKMQAIKELRKASKCGLMEAKDYVEKL